MFWQLSSWAEEEEEAARRHLYQPVWGPESEQQKSDTTLISPVRTPPQTHCDLLPVQTSWGWAEADRWGRRGLWDAAGRAAGRAAVWSDVGEDRCGRPAAAGGDDVDLEDDYVGDGDGDDDEGVVVGRWSTPNEAPLRLSRKKMSIDDGSGD